MSTSPDFFNKINYYDQLISDSYDYIFDWIGQSTLDIWHGMRI